MTGSVYSVDVDGDGDMDVLSASEGDHKIAWYENDGNENFITHTITTSADVARSVYAIDVDGDGDMDVLSASSNDDKIAWYENDGNENFFPHTITTGADGAFSVLAIDIDNDGDMDVISASQFNDKVTWYENLLIVGIEAISNETPNEFRLSQNYPNPFNPSTTIRYALPEESDVELIVYDVLGNEIVTLVNEVKQEGSYTIEFDATTFPSGIYFYKLQTVYLEAFSEQGFVETKKMILLR